MFVAPLSYAAMVVTVPLLPIRLPFKIKLLVPARLPMVPVVEIIPFATRLLSPSKLAIFPATYVGNNITQSYGASQKVVPK